MICEKFKYYCEIADKCYTLAATAALMEVTGYQPWGFEERMNQCKAIKRKCPDCKTAFLVDENSEKELSEKVKQAKKDGLIDQFIYSSTSASYLIALMETL